MKKTAKFLICGAALLFGGVLLSSCTASFCSVNDQGNMLYAFDGGVTFYNEAVTDNPLVIIDRKGEHHTIEGVYCTYSYKDPDPKKAKENQGLAAAAKSAYSSGIPGIIWDNDKNCIKDCTANDCYLEYYKYVDNLVLLTELEQVGHAKFETAEQRAQIKNDILDYKKDGKGKKIGEYPSIPSISAFYGHYKYTGENKDKNQELWIGYDKITSDAVKYFTAQGLYDYVPSTDFRTVYKNQMNGLIRNYRTCLTTIDGFYGSYGEKKQSVYIESKSYQYGWSKGFFDGLLVWPIGGFIDVLATSFGAATATNGVPQILAIVLVTVIIRLVLVAATFKSTLANAKMTELQPEITKIQNKYPNSKTNNYEKQKMAQDMQALYKKNKINPFSTIIVLIIQFPIFICVWGALSGSAILSSGTFLGLDLSSSISSVLFVGNNWTAAGNYCAVTAFFLFLIMAGAQTVSMLLPQWIQKKKAKQVAKLGKNPSQKSQNNKMKWFTYIMLAMIIFMGFSLVSAMGVYWLIGALFSIAQTLITQAILEHKHNKRS